MAKEIKIPFKLNKIISEADETLDGFVKSSLAEFGPWLRENNVKFFTEYTGHSLKHVEDVLETADRLIPEDKDCLDIITAGDAATLIVAALLHDCAMHLSVDGFATLIKSDQKIPGFDDKPWSELWEDFIAEVRRFSGRELMDLFGDTEAIKPPPSDPNDLDSHKMTGKDLLLIGEFLRRHHHRLGHEIAVYGVPGPDDQRRLKLPGGNTTEHIVELAGVVARSHGLPIRACHDYLQDNFGDETSFKKVHPVFLMALLRLADILQLQSERAPEYVEKVRTIRSPKSQAEWKMHQAIKDINWETKYPETIFIHAKPPDARTYIKIKKLLVQIQYELDTSWAAISEIFLKVEGLEKLGLSIRRVRSNLDDVKTFSKQVEYIPCEASFEVANTDLLKLLIGPLYGERPEFGIRELMQNALDAVREAQEYQRRHPELNDVEYTRQEAEVVISIDKDKKADDWWITVSDQGIGMTLDTVRNYFLKAGASLRRSEIWRKTFEDDQGKSRVMRSGRFGVGVLASFLLGDEIHVSTRHISEPDGNGINFSSKLDDENVELQKITRPVGTTISVHINEKVKDELLEENRCDWYCLKEPEVLFFTDHGRNESPRLYELPPLNSKLPDEWHRISHPDYQDIHWTYSDAPILTCNGIKIEDDTLELGHLYEFLKNPNVSVFDYDANLPLNLQRTELTQERYPFHETLLNDILKDFIAFMFVHAPSQSIENTPILEWCSQYHYPGCPDVSDSLFQKPYLFPWFFTKTGISFTNCFWCTNQINTPYALFIHTYYPHSKGLTLNLARNFSHSIFGYGHLEYSTSNIDQAKTLKKIIEHALNIKNQQIHGGLARLFTMGKRALISRHVLEFIKKVSGFENKDLLSEIPVTDVVEEWKNENWVLWRLGECPQAGFDFEKFAAENDGKNHNDWPCILTERYFKKKKPNIEKLSSLDKVWKEVVGSPIIPFDLEERRRMKAYKELKSYIEAHEKMK
jgi:molecular chaperone HtpG